jgi:hypothetical protein
MSKLRKSKRLKLSNLSGKTYDKQHISLSISLRLTAKTVRPGDESRGLNSEGNSSARTRVLHGVRADMAAQILLAPPFKLIPTPAEEKRRRPGGLVSGS